MSVMLLVQTALAAGTGLWLSGTPDPTEETTLQHCAIDTLRSEQHWTERDELAIQFLNDELEASKPLLNEFDGELLIMRRLEDALQAITVVRPEDRDVIYRALLFQGLAVERYFQDGLAEEPGAEPYRLALGEAVLNRPWINAIALDPDRQASLTEIPEAPELQRFHDLRAQHLLSPTITISVDHLPEGLTLMIDGRAMPTEQARVLAGTHWAAIVQEDDIRQRTWWTYTPSTEPVTLAVTAQPEDIADLLQSVETDCDVISLNPRMLALLDDVEAPVHLYAPGDRGVHHYIIEGGSAVRVGHAASTRKPRMVQGHVAIGGGWINDDDYMLLNQQNGAPSEMATTNAAASMITAGIQNHRHTFVWGAGVDAVMPHGEWQTLPTGSQTLRLRAYPHLTAGIAPLQATIGWLFPWQLGVGMRAHHTLHAETGLALNAAWVYGVGIPQSRDFSETFEPSMTQMAWLGVGLRR